MKRTPFKRKQTKPLKRSLLRQISQSPNAQAKQRIQVKVREIVILRDKGCILRQKRFCGGDVGFAVLQADHLITRANSATYGDTRLIVCVCKPCHAWKSLGNNARKREYDALVKTVISPERVKLWEQMEADSWRGTKVDWQIIELQLEQEYRALVEN